MAKWISMVFQYVYSSTILDDFPIKASILFGDRYNSCVWDGATSHRRSQGVEQHGAGRKVPAVARATYKKDTKKNCCP